MGMTAIPNPDSPATPVTGCPPAEQELYGGGDSISQMHPSDAKPQPSGTMNVDVLGSDGALRI